MSDESIYQPPVAPPLLPPQPLQQKPGVATVFGILHLVFAGFGLIMGLWGLFTVMVGNPLLHKMSEMPGMQGQAEMQLSLQERMKPMTIASSSLSIIVGAIMIVAGIKLLQGRRNAIKWSNTYAATSILAKIVNVILSVTMMLPMMKSAIGSAGGSDMAGATFAGGVVGAIAGTLATCIYPVLTLILLNQAGIKAWFASRPK